MLPAVPTTLSFAPNLPALLQGSRVVLVVAPASVFAGELPSLLPGPAQTLLTELARDTKPGDLGSVASTLTGLAEPRRVAIGVLPDQGSRYNSPARGESVRKVVASADLGNTGKAAVILLLPDAAHLLAAANACYVPDHAVLVCHPEQPLADGLDHHRQGKSARAGRATAYVCHGPVCSAPIVDPALLRVRLSGRRQ